MANVHRGARLQRPSIGRERRVQELLELLGRHLVALDLQLLLRVALVIHVVGRIGEHQVGLLPAVSRSTASNRGRIPAEQPMVPRTHRSPGSVSANSGTAGASSSSVKPFGLLGQQFVDLIQVETRQIEIEFLQLEACQLEREGFHVPDRLFVGAVISQTIRVNLRGS